jgi:CheY-like chemotaxis protein
VIEQTRPLSGLRFLVVEDEIVQALLLGEMLTEMGGVVSETAFGYDQARDAIHKDAFDCAVLDVNLGGTLTFSLADALKNRGIPFVFCTAFADGVDAYPYAHDILRVDKPVRSEALRDAVLSVLVEAD